jgi:hypothetical protein
LGGYEFQQIYRGFIAALFEGIPVKKSLPAGEYESQWKPLHQKMSIFRTPGTALHITRRIVWAPLGIANQKMDSPDSQSI